MSSTNEAPDGALRKALFDALVEYSGRRKWYGHDLADALAATIEEQFFIAERRDPSPAMALRDYAEGMCRCYCIANHPSQIPVCRSVHLPEQEVCVVCIAAFEHEVTANA